jgi:hypothetical protein
VPWWDAGAIGAAQARKAQLQANHEAWVAGGMHGKIGRCGPKVRPYLRVDEAAGGYGEQGDYRMILGY